MKLDKDQENEDIESLIIKDKDSVIESDILEVPDYSYWASQEPLDWQFQVRNITQKQVGKKYCLTQKLSNQSIPDNSYTKVLFDDYSTNDNGMIWISNRINIIEDWYYFINIWTLFASNATWVRRIYVEIVTPMWTFLNEHKNAVNWTTTSLNASWIIYLTSWTKLELYVRQNSWWSLNINWWKETFLNVFKI